MGVLGVRSNKMLPELSSISADFDRRASFLRSSWSHFWLLPSLSDTAAGCREAVWLATNRGVGNIRSSGRLIEISFSVCTDDHLFAIEIGLSLPNLAVDAKPFRYSPKIVPVFAFGNGYNVELIRVGEGNSVELRN